MITTRQRPLKAPSDPPNKKGVHLHTLKSKTFTKLRFWT